MLPTERSVYGWVVNTARRHFWRVPRWYDFDDLVQDGMVTFCRVEKKYRGKVKNERHMMRLFQIAFINHIHDLSELKTRGALEIPVDMSLDMLDEFAASEDDWSSLLTSLVELPANIFEALCVLIDCVKPDTTLRKLVSPPGVMLPAPKAKVSAAANFTLLSQLIEVIDVVPQHKNLGSQHRAQHGVPPMEGDESLSLSAWLQPLCKN